MKLVCFDLDGTIIDVEFIWYLLHKSFNIDEGLVKEWHRKFDQGIVSYEEWFAEDVKWWKSAGKKKADFIEVLSGIHLMPGARELISELKARGVKLAIISGSLRIVVDYFFPKMTFDHILINELNFDNTGEIQGFHATPYDFAHKRAGIVDIAKKEGLDLSEIVFIGDNYNDIEAVKIAGLGISFNSKSDELDTAADIVIPGKNILDVLRYL